MVSIVFINTCQTIVLFSPLGRFEGIVFRMYDDVEMDWVGQLEGCYKFKVFDDTRC